MRRLVLALLAISAPAFAGTYDDFSRGIDANNRGDAAAAIQFFTRAIDGGDLAPSYLPSARFGRARALLHDRRCGAARADLTEAIRLRADFVDAYSLRAEADLCLEHDGDAMSDATAAIRLKPAAGYYFTRARIRWGMGDFAGARSDAHEAAARDPGNAYVLLWQAIADGRAGGFDPAAFALRTAGLDGWPKPLLDLFAGRASPQDVERRAAGNPNQKCEADFYVGEWRLGRGDAGRARDLFQTASGECPRDYIAFDAAQRELRRF